MLEQWFSSVLPATVTGSAFPILPYLLCTLCSLALGGVIAAGHTFRNTYSKSFVTTLALLPAIVQMVIMLVNGNLGTGVAVMGAFSLIRFRSVPGTAREIGSIFLSMAVGLATGTGYLAAAVLFTLILELASLLCALTRFGEGKREERALKITIPENLDYSTVFDDLMEQYASHWELAQVRTAEMGSLYKLHYRVVLKNPAEEKAFIDALRCRNGNLEISCGRPVSAAREEL